MEGKKLHNLMHSLTQQYFSIAAMETRPFKHKMFTTKMPHSFFFSALHHSTDYDLLFGIADQHFLVMLLLQMLL